MIVSDTGPHANKIDFRPGDVGVMRKNFGHSVENTGTDTLVFVNVFWANHHGEVSLVQWISHARPELVTQHLNIAPAVLQHIPHAAQGIVPLRP